MPINAQPELGASTILTKAHRSAMLHAFLWLMLGIILVTAATLKSQSATIGESSVASGLFDNPTVLWAAIAAECILGTALMVRLWPRVVRWIAVATFGAFFCVALYKFLHHETTCGCFGAVRVHPGYTAGFDLAVVVAMLFTRPPADVPVTARRIAVGIGVLAMSGIAIALASRWHPQTVTLGAMPSITTSQPDPFGAAGSLVVLEPEKWVGGTFPLFGHIDLGARLLSGRWTVLLVHHDCDHCIAAVGRYSAGVGGVGGSGSGVGSSAQAGLAVIEMPPFADAGEPMPWVLPPSVLSGRLDTTRDWFATTPVILELQDGKVTSAHDGAQ